jgi:hypothetical protein
MMQSQQPQNINVLPPVSWRTIPIAEEWNASFRSFKQSAYRLETLQEYAEPSESSPFKMYLRGIKPDESFSAEWCGMVRDHIDAGRTMRRVHIVDLPLSEYMRFEIECCYHDTGLAGEEIRLLDRSKITPDLAKITQEDFWMFDESTIMVNDYDNEGRLYQARITTDPAAVKYYSNVDRRIWDLGVPFRQFYKTHTGLEL